MIGMSGQSITAVDWIVFIIKSEGTHDVIRKVETEHPPPRFFVGLDFDENRSAGSPERVPFSLIVDNRRHKTEYLWTKFWFVIIPVTNTEV